MEQRPLNLPTIDVAVWRVDLDAFVASTPILWPTLSPAEHERAARFRSERDRGRFVVRRAALRSILGLLLRRPPADVTLAKAASGKPFVPGERAVRFNVTDSASLALIAVAPEHDVGVDLERLDRSHGAEEVARHFFAAAEVAELERLPPAIRWRAFLHCWTRKEAYVKARGQGLSLGLDTFDVSLALGGPPEPVRTTAEPDADERWSVYGFTPAADYAAALAVEGRPWRLVWRQLPERLEGCSPGK